MLRLLFGGVLLIFSVLYANEVQSSPDKELDESAIRYVYHVKQKDFIGNLIYPLNTLRLLPQFEFLFQKYSKKYLGRDVGTVWIDKLECGWHDVVFLSTLHPYQDFLAQKEAGLSPESREYFCIPISNLEEKAVVVWEPPSVEGASRFDDAYFEWMDLVKLPPQNEVSEKTKNYYRSCAHSKIKPKTFHTHLLVKGSVDISNAKVIKWDEIEPMSDH